MQCDVCPRHSRLHHGQRGLCFVRSCDRNGVELYTYGRSSHFCNGLRFVYTGNVHDAAGGSTWCPGSDCR